MTSERSVGVEAPEANRAPLSIHIAHESDDGSMPDHFLCGAPIRVLLPGERLAGDVSRSECAVCNRLDAEYANGS